MKKVYAMILLGVWVMGWGKQAGAGEFTTYGFVRFDAIVDDSRLSHPQFPNWVRSEAPGAEDDAQLSLHPRLTRVGAKFKPVELDENTKISGVIEADFQNGGKESREILRMRHAYFNLQRGDWHFLAGQTWALISPLYPAANNDGMMWHAGNLGDRHPQARVSYKPEGGFSLALAVGQTGSVDGQDLDGNGVLDGSDATLPFVQTRVGLAKKKFKAGVWGHWASEEVSPRVDAEGQPLFGGETSFTSTAVGVDASISLSDMLAIEGEGWAGSNLTDMRGGIGQGINGATGEEIASVGGWAQLVVKPNDQWKLFAGATMDTPDEDDVPEGGRTKNQAFFAVGRYKPWKNFQAAFEYLNWKTEYKNGPEGTANRVDIHFTYSY
ncbi:MAG: hypothetical protein GKR89_34770 [Candidatus Latescibacteria bacterium]|nr:hypothetical protein [Candidatus Latescibacterota bacterium]